MAREAWVKWSEALLRIKEAGFDPRLLLDWILADELQPRAHSLFVAHDLQRMKSIPKQAWTGLVTWDHEGEVVQDGTWVEERGQLLSVRAVGIEFRRDEFDALLPPKDASVAAVASARRKGGAPPKIDEWHRFWLEAVRMADAGKLRDFKSQAELRRSLLDHSASGLSEEAVKQPVRRIWQLIHDE